MKFQAIHEVGNYPGHLVQFWLLTAIALVLGIVVYTLLVYPGSRREKFRELAGVRRWVGFAAALVVSSLVGGTAYALTWSDFYTLEILQDEIRISYFLPERKVDIPRQEVDRILEEPRASKADERSIVIYTLDGDRHESGPMTRGESRKVHDELRAWLSARPK